jgi:hypothetical protein
MLSPLRKRAGSRLRKPFGKAGLTVAIFALVFAMVGGAYAAGGGLSSKQKKQVKQIAKTEAQTYANSNPGAEGKQGPEGKQGASGKDGANGKDGTDGTNGKNVVVGTEPTGTVKCNEQGGATVEVEGQAATKKYVCNGETGFTETLPSGKTETGVYGFRIEAGNLVAEPVSFNIPLASTPAASSIFYVTKEEVEEDTAPSACPGSVTAPEAKVVAPSTSPAVCVYENTLENFGEGGGYFAQIGYPKVFTTGVVLLFVGETGAVADGTYAVTAP